MNSYEYYMNKGRELEERKLYRRAAEQYNKAAFISSACQEGAAKKAAERCLIKSKIKITEGL
ncbi:hypothetical protein CYG68_06475 [Morganella morganii]|uniref:Uncharacterized protein n=1 Tax=Morganella morganii TaxID=582 RepID=A0A8I0PTJ2_MORMO|nr:hypothetical protein [Morganella morganii]MBE8612063.1 hypothetical protein [Morganella morganii]